TMKKIWVLILLSVTGYGQTAPAQRAAVKPHRLAVPTKSIVDSVIDLVQHGMSEGLVIKQLQRDGKSYERTTPALVKRQKAGVSETISNVMRDPKTTVPPAAPSPAASNLLANKESSPGGAPFAPAPPPPAGADTAAVAADTPYPPDLANVPTMRKRRVVI